jgi:hypothetical protein
MDLTFTDDAFGDGPRGDFGHGTHTASNPDARFALAKLPPIEEWPVSNVSMRGNVSAERPLIVGFFLRDRRDVMIRVVGPSLRNFGVSQPWGNPRFQLFQAGVSDPISGGSGPRHAIAYYPDWSSSETSTPALIRLFSYVGAFPLDAGSGDSVGVSPRMPAGSYTIVCTPDAGDNGGETLVEVYFLP